MVDKRRNALKYQLQKHLKIYWQKPRPKIWVPHSIIQNSNIVTTRQRCEIAITMSAKRKPSELSFWFRVPAEE